MAKRPCAFCGYVAVKVATHDGFVITQCTSCSSILEKKEKIEEKTTAKEELSSNN